MPWVDNGYTSPMANTLKTIADLPDSWGQFFQDVHDLLKPSSPLNSPDTLFIVTIPDVDSKERLLESIIKGDLFAGTRIKPPSRKMLDIHQSMNWSGRWWMAYFNCEDGRKLSQRLAELAAGVRGLPMVFFWPMLAKLLYDRDQLGPKVATWGKACARLTVRVAYAGEGFTTHVLDHGLDPKEIVEVDPARPAKTIDASPEKLIFEIRNPAATILEYLPDLYAEVTGELTAEPTLGRPLENNQEDDMAILHAWEDFNPPDGRTQKRYADFGETFCPPLDREAVRKAIGRAKKAISKYTKTPE